MITAPRYVVLDTETTGLDPAQGHRMVEIGLVEIIQRQRRKVWQQYLNPERDSDPEALRIHGLTADFLSAHPLFERIIEPFLAFLEDSPLIIHNAPFDLKFLDHQLSQAGYKPLSKTHQVIDTLPMARALYPGKKVSLDALCDRYRVERSQRSYHGAALDAALLADVYLRMTQGQEVMFGEEAAQEKSGDYDVNNSYSEMQLKEIITEETSLAAHQKYLHDMQIETKSPVIWLGGS